MTGSSGDPEHTQRAARYWDASHAAGSAADSFLDHPLIHAYISMRALGSTRSHMQAAIDEVERRTAPGARILSVGCGAALKERAICEALPDRTVIGIDIAQETLARTLEQAQAQGIHNLELAHGDFNNLEVEHDSFDMVLGLGAFHHIENLEGFWQACRRALRPGGCVLAQEYVGPSRFQWSDAQIEHGNHTLRTLVPEHHQVHHREVRRIRIEKLIAIDPSEAVRSAEIVATCEASGLRIEDYRGGGCGLLQPVLMDQMHTFDPRNWEHNHVLFTLFREDDRLIRQGLLGDSYAMFVAA